MDPIQKTTYQTLPVPSADSDAETGLEVNESITVALYQLEGNNRITVFKKRDETTIERYNFDVVEDFRQCRYRGDGQVPFEIQACLADFGFYDTAISPRLIGQHEYLIDAGGWLEDRARSNSEILAYFFEEISIYLYFMTIDSIAEIEFSNRDTSKSEVVNETGLPDENMVELVMGTRTLKQMPKSKHTKIPAELERFVQAEGTIGLYTDEWASISVIDSDQYDTVVVILITPNSVNYYPFDGQLGGNCSFRREDYHELPGPLIVDYLETEFDTNVVNLPRIRTGDTDIEILNKTSDVLKSVDHSTRMPVNSDNGLFEMADLLVNFCKLIKFTEEALGDDYFRNQLSDVMQEQSDVLSIENLDRAGTKHVDVVSVMVSVALQRLSKDEKEQIQPFVIEDQYIPIGEQETTFDAHLRKMADEFVEIDVDQID